MLLAYPLGYATLAIMIPDTQKLIHHISRLEGQLQSIKRELASVDPDCEKMARTLKASSRSFSTLRMAFVTCFLEHRFRVKKAVTDPAYDALMEVIST